MQDYYLTEKKYFCRDTQETCIGYSNYLQTEHWKRFRDSIIKQRKKCECCGVVKPIMNVHHISYSNLGKEKGADVALLCVDCHKYIHQIKDGKAVCSDERILRFVRKYKKKKNNPKIIEKVCENCIFFTRSKEGGKSHPLCTKTMIYYPQSQIEYRCRSFKSKYDTSENKKSANKKQKSNGKKTKKSTKTIK